MSKHWRKWHNEDKVEKLTDEECISLLSPPKVDFWVHNHCLFLWRFLYWNWFNIWTGEEGFWLFARHWFREWGK